MGLVDNKLPLVKFFGQLSQYPPAMDDADLRMLEKFVNTMYDKNSTVDGVDDARFDLFARKQRSYDAIPPTRSSLAQHVKRATYQAACVLFIQRALATGVGKQATTFGK